jgi:hypothetical protein
MWTHNFNVPEARMWAHNLRFQSKYMCPYFKVKKPGCGPINRSFRRKDVTPDIKVTTACLWVTVSRLKQLECEHYFKIIEAGM